MISPPPIDAQKAATRIVRALAPVAFHNQPELARVTLHCQTTSIVRVSCVLRGYTRRDRVRLRVKLSGTLIRARRPLVFEDYSGWVRYSAARTIYVDPA